MDETTYRDPEVDRLLAQKFVAVRVDIDERPDLAERYGDWAGPRRSCCRPTPRSSASSAATSRPSG